MIIIPSPQQRGHGIKDLGIVSVRWGPPFAGPIYLPSDVFPSFRRFVVPEIPVTLMMSEPSPRNRQSNRDDAVR